MDVEKYAEALMNTVMAKRGPKPKPKADSSEQPVSENLISTSIRMQPRLLDALDALINAQTFKTTRTDVIEVALQELLKAYGFWPWPKPDDKKE